MMRTIRSASMLLLTEKLWAEIMAKRSKRRPTQPHRNNVGCMWGLINLFDFRRGHPTQKLLSDKKHGSNRHIGTGYSKIKLDSLRNSHETGTLVDEIRQDQASLGLASIKELIEEEMFQSLIKKISMDEAQRVTSSTQREVPLRWNYKLRRQKSKLIHGNQGKNGMDVSGSLDGIHSGSMDLTEISSLTFDVPALLLDLESYTVQQANIGSNDKFDLRTSLESTSLDEKISLVQHTLAEFAQIIAGQKSMIEGQNHGQLSVQPKMLMDRLDVANSDKELFMKLLQDPDSFLLKFIQNLHDVQVKKASKLGSERYSENVALLVEENGNSGKSNESDGDQSLQKQKRYNFFWRKDKLKATKQTKQNSSSEALSKIVVLRPNRVRSLNSSFIITPSSSPQSNHVLKYNENGERIASNFSIKEIKRKIQQIFCESRQTHVISMDGIRHRIPVRSTDYGDLSELIHGGSAAASSVSHCCDDNKLTGSFDLDNVSKKITSEEKFEVNGNSHISHTASRSESFIYEEARKHLAEMLDTRVDGLPRVQSSEPLVKLLSLVNFNELSPASSPQEDEFAMSSKETGDSSLRHLDKGEFAETSSLEATYVAGSTEIIEMVDTKRIVDSNELAVPLESSGSELIVVNEICEEESTTSPGSVQSNLRPSNLAGENLITLGRINEKPEQPSPVSVLEPLVSDDINNPNSADIDNYDNQVRHQQAVHEDGNNFVGIVESPDSNVRLRDYLQDYQARFDYVKVVLEASGLTNEFPRKWNMEDQLLEPSLFNEIGIFFCFLQDDPKLLFDCMNEVLSEMHEKFLKCTPWLSFIKQNVLPVPLGGSLIHEVGKGLEWHLRIHLPNTLDQVVKKGLEGQCWIDLRFEAENITNKLCDAILDDAVKEIVFDSMC
ncbi:uncharacterized protein LOC122007991 isoform X1 [Zingiber officinale]|uniref:uncharacterized protein LOC122007991 isoform X1 n=2 Tax=Zingiber officinale TaxID=94328 RepID=UPI001C4B1031|nr:uncharacterized protein LOC122007991 isoform X1 [Zingiber officinale]